MLSSADNAAVFFSSLRETPWAEHVKVVLKTGAGMKLNSMNFNLWQPLTNMSLETWADFATRLPKDMVSVALPCSSALAGPVEQLREQEPSHPDMFPLACSPPTAAPPTRGRCL